jgi:hypothetical protein
MLINNATKGGPTPYGAAVVGTKKGWQGFRPERHDHHLRMADSSTLLPEGMLLDSEGKLVWSYVHSHS